MNVLKWQFFHATLFSSHFSFHYLMELSKFLNGEILNEFECLVMNSMSKYDTWKGYLPNSALSMLTIIFLDNIETDACQIFLIISCGFFTSVCRMVAQKQNCESRPEDLGDRNSFLEKSEKTIKGMITLYHVELSAL